MWGRRTLLVVMEGAETAIRYRNDILGPILQPYRQNFAEELVLMDDNSRLHRAHLVNKFLHDNISRLEWPACSPDMNPIDQAWDTLKRAVLVEITQKSLWDIYAICRWGVGQSGPTVPWWTSGQYATSNTDMHQYKKECYWVLEGTGLSFNLAHKFKKYSCIIVQLGIFCFHAK